MLRFYTHIFAFLFLLFSSCTSEQENKSKSLDKKVVKQHLERANKHLVKVEEQNIRDYISRYGYDMKETGSGLFYEIYKKSDGQKAAKGKIASLNFDISLLSGKEIYSSEKEGLKEFLIGKGGVESGLEEGILLMKTGEKGRFIIPSHLAYGLLGDLDKIPEKATIVYNIELISLKEKVKSNNNGL